MDISKNANFGLRDLKPENILCADNNDDFPQVKIADFGTSRKIRRNAYSYCGTLGYIAPEIKDGLPYTKKVDMWSLGCILYNLLCGGSTSNIIEKINTGWREFYSPLWDEVSAEAMDMIEKLLVFDPSKRLGIKQILRHPWMQEEI